MSRFGRYRKPIPLYEAFIDWRQDVSDGLVQLEEADSKADFPSFLFGPVRQALWQGYEYVQGQYRRYARVENAPDFRQRRLYGLNKMTKPGYVGDHGEYPQMKRGERPPATLVIDTYGGEYSITRQAVINDESGELLRSAPEEMGDSAATFIVESIIALIESNPTAPDGLPMWSTTRGNAGTLALSEDSIVTAIAAMTKQTDDTGRKIVVRPRTLVVGDPRQELIANRIIRSQEAGTTVNWTGGAGAGSQVFDKGTLNPVASILPNDAVVYDPYFSDANDWYLFADPARVPAFAVGFLNGQERPEVFLKNPEAAAAMGGGGEDPYTFHWDTIDFKVRMDFGSAPVDPRGTYKNTVA